MKTGATAGEKEIQTTGFFVFGALTLIVALLKLAVFSDWSWWRVSLPILIFVGFNIAYIVTGFGYLSFAEARERPSRDEVNPLGQHHGPLYWSSMLFFAAFADNLVRYLEGTEDSFWFWGLSGLCIVKTAPPTKSRTYAPLEFRAEDGETPPLCSTLLSSSSHLASVPFGRCVGAVPTWCWRTSLCGSK